MATDFTIKHNDLLPEFGVTLKDAQQAIVNLTGCTVLFLLTNKETNELKVAAPATITGSPSAGKVRYVWQVGDTDVVGTYKAEWQVTFPDGRPETFPNGSFQTIKIGPDLGDVANP